MAAPLLAQTRPAQDTITAYHAQYAWLGGDSVDAEVMIELSGEEIVSVTAGAPAGPGAIRLDGLTLPGLANAHSHAFHRALRGHVQRGTGSFWTWREDMYAVAARLDPDSYHALARAVFAEMALAGITCVGEFHYLHHGPGGVRYDSPNAVGEALIDAAAAAGIRITLLDACYLAGGFGEPLRGPQLRFGDGDADQWAERVSALVEPRHVRVGAAIHSVRAVPAGQLAAVAAWAAERDAPLHFHLSEQPAENAACIAACGCTPTALLAEHGALGPCSCAVHATHLSDADIALLGGSRTGVCFCPTTERDLADGIGPAGDLAQAGSPLSLGSDSQAVIDPFEEARALELDERLATGRRGTFSAAAVLAATSAAGHQTLGWSDAGRIAPGARADLVTLDLNSSRLAGWVPESLLASAAFAASAVDVHNVIIDGRPVVSGGRHLLIDNPLADLHRAIGELRR